MCGLILITAIAAGCAAREPEVSSGADAAGDDIRSVLDAQVHAWNDGNIEEFMEGYARTDTLRFASGGTVWHGWEQTLQRYHQSYQDTSAMGSLAFEDLEIWPISDQFALVFGRWELERADRHSDIGGLFTLVFQRGEEGWRIVHDHTSSGSGSEAEDTLTT
jgi:ketosteroid isomerase-like protein